MLVDGCWELAEAAALDVEALLSAGNADVPGTGNDPPNE